MKNSLMATVLLSKEEQAIFSKQVEEEVVRIMEELNRRWKQKPTMINLYATCVENIYVTYRRPSIQIKELHPEIGVAVFIAEEQIDDDHCDPQIRHTLYVHIAGREKAECMAEDHGYSYREGGACLKVIEVKREFIIIQKKKERVTISLD